MSTYEKFVNAAYYWEDHIPDWKPHTITTEDGYIITVFQLHSKEYNGESKGSILLQNGLFEDASSWLQTPQNEKNAAVYNIPLPLRLIENGYDVWLGNMRGSTYSRHHTHFDANDPTSRYWNFSLIEKGYD